MNPFYFKLFNQTTKETETLKVWGFDPPIFSVTVADIIAKQNNSLIVEVWQEDE